MNLNKLFLFISITLLALAGCQQEVSEVQLPLPAEAFSANSKEADFITRTTLQDGSYDNILDSTSCISLALPVTVIVNGQEIVVNTLDDLKYVERILDADTQDEDEVNILFPVTIVLADHSEMVIENEDAFEDIVDTCVEDGADDDIECIDFVYPVSLTAYDTTSQTSEVITIHSDSELHDFIEGLEGDEFVSFKFPVVMQLMDGTEITIYNNEELENAIEDSSNDCDEDDDNDFDDDDVDDSSIIATLTTGSWRVSEFIDETNETSQFLNYSFTFFADGTAVASNGVLETEGTWATYGDDGKLELYLDFGEVDPFGEIEEDWEVIEFSSSKITLRDEKEMEAAKSLIFEKI